MIIEQLLLWQLYIGFLIEVPDIQRDVFALGKINKLI